MKNLISTSFQKINFWNEILIKFIHTIKEHRHQVITDS